MLNKETFPWKESISKETLIAVLNDFALKNDYSLASDVWFNSVKELASAHNFATNNKEYKKDPTKFTGNVADVAEIIRIALVGSKNSPNLYYVINVLTKKEVDRRIKEVIELLKR